MQMHAMLQTHHLFYLANFGTLQIYPLTGILSRDSKRWKRSRGTQIEDDLHVPKWLPPQSDETTEVALALLL